MRRSITYSLLALILILSFSGYSAVNDLKSDAQTQALGFTFAADSDALFYLNPAAISNNKYKGISYTYSSIPLLDLDSRLVAAKFGHFGLVAATTKVLDVADRGNYIDQRINLSYGRSLWAEAKLGLNLKYYSMKLEDLTSSTISLDGAMLYSISNKISAGLVVSNLVSTVNNSSGSQEAVPVEIRGGISYSPSQNTKVNIDLDQNKMLYMGLEQQVAPGIKVRMGSENGELRVGFGMAGERICCDYVYSLNGLIDNQLLTLALKF